MSSIGSSLINSVTKRLPAPVRKGVDAVAKLIPESLKRRREPPDPTLNGFSSQTSLSYPNSRMICGLDQTVDIPYKTLFKEAPPVGIKEMKLWLQEHKPILKYERPEMYRHVRGPQHGETDIRYDFTTDEAFNHWKIGSDSLNGQGYSKCQFTRTDSGTALFTGTLSTKIVKDGRAKRAGWCAIKTDDRHAFMRRKRYTDWQYYSHLLIKLRGDGRSYKVMLHVQEMMDVAWGDNYSYPLHTHGGPYWQYERIPFSRFIKTCGGRVQDRQEELPRFRINAVGITLMDRIEGDFRLELGFVGAVNDISHMETFAYEYYQLPIMTTAGI